MNQQITLFGDPASISDLAGRAISAVVNGDISPIDAHIQISRMENAIKQFTATEKDEKEPEPIARNVSDLLDELIEQSVKVVGKPVALMNKEDKVKAVQFLNETGAFLITKSGDRVCKFFGISKYTLYSYIDESKA